MPGGELSLGILGNLMPNPVRNTFQFYNSFVPNLSALYAEVDIGAVGAPTISALASMGIDSISRSGAGQYLVTLNKKYQRLCMLSGNFVAAGGAASPNVSVESEAVASAGTLIINCQNGGMNTDPASGETMLLMIHLKNSSVAVG